MKTKVLKLILIMNKTRKLIICNKCFVSLNKRKMIIILIYYELKQN